MTTIAQTFTTFGAGLCVAIATICWLFSILSKRYSLNDDPSVGCFATLLQMIALLLLAIGSTLMVAGLNI